MMETLKKQIKWRRDRKGLFIRDCKNSIDLKLSFEHELFLKKLFCGISFEELDETEKLIFLEFKKLDFLTSLKLKQLPPEDFFKGMTILDNELGSQRVRSTDFLRKKFEESPKFFMGIYLGDQLVGVICGFSREDYLLISEIAVDCRFRQRGFGAMLVKKFEEIGFGKYDKINVGALDDSMEFYRSLGYKPFLLVQFKEGDYRAEDFSDFKIIRFEKGAVELEIQRCNIDLLNKMRKDYPRANLQYIFTKER